MRAPANNSNHHSIFSFKCKSSQLILFTSTTVYITYICLNQTKLNRRVFFTGSFFHKGHIRFHLTNMNFRLYGK